MKKIMAPRFTAGQGFFDKAFFDCYKRIGYPDRWLEEAQTYAPENAYVISHPTWFYEPIPEVPEISIYDLFSRTVEKYPDDVAVIFLDKAATYRELDIMIRKYAAFLKEIGVGKNSVVATMLPNSLQHIVAFYASAFLGAIHTPIDVMYKTKEIADQLKDSGARIILVLDQWHEKVADLKADGLIDHEIVTHLSEWMDPQAVMPSNLKMCWDTPKRSIAGTSDLFACLEKYAPLTDPAVVDPRKEVALLLYTAGTTGKTKGVLETHFNLVFNSLTHIHAARPKGERVINFAIMPMFHTSGYLLHQLPVFYQGGTVIPIPLFDLVDAFRVIETYRVNVIAAPPTFFIALMKNRELMAEHDLSSLRITIGCAAPVPVEVQDKWKRMTGLDLVNGWGMTETNSGGITSIPGIKEKFDSIGIPLYSEVKITDEWGDIVGRNQEGEICYRGLQVAAGYYNNPKETEMAFLPDGWLRTGDKGFVDKEDFVHFAGRIKHLIVVSGYNVSPVEIEHVLYLHPAVEEAMVTGHPDPYKGETVKATISLKLDYMGRITEQDIIDFCKKHLATYKVPKIVDFRDILPKSPTGKLMRQDAMCEDPFS
jgi:long-chain acyl-CoA synthetase